MGAEALGAAESGVATLESTSTTPKTNKVGATYEQAPLQQTVTKATEDTVAKSEDTVAMSEQMDTKATATLMCESPMSSGSVTTPDASPKSEDTATATATATLNSTTDDKAVAETATTWN